MSEPAPPGWSPLPEETHETQLGELEQIARAFPHRARILDLGAGDGRLAKPLLELGFDVTAVDNDPRALAALRDAGIGAIRWDITAPGESPGALAEGAFDIALCAGNTFCLVHEPDEALRLVRRVRGWLGDGGIFAIDDVVTDTWRDVAEGYWQAGLSESGDQQLVWARGDNVIAIREDDRVDSDNWSVTTEDTPMRLWTWGELTLLARAGCIAGPRTSPLGSLILFS